jgi:hypothetical protein
MAHLDEAGILRLFCHECHATRHFCRLSVDLEAIMDKRAADAMVCADRAGRA